MKFNVDYNLIDEKGEEINKGKAEAIIDKENFLFQLKPEFNEGLSLSFRDIFEIKNKDYKIYLSLSGGGKLVLSNLGYQHDPFLKNLCSSRNELIIKDLLIKEALKKSNVRAEFLYQNQKGVCEIRLYETALVVLPEEGEVVRIPYGRIEKIEAKDYQITILTEENKKIIFSQLGEDFEPFSKALSDLVNKLSLTVQESLKELFPDSDPLTLMKVAHLMKEGKAVKNKDIEAISSQLWQELEKRLEVIGIKEEYDFLSSLSQKDRVCIGFKKGLMGSLSGDYIWFLIPIYSTNSTVLGNAVAMEASSEGEGGRATYFFRIVKRRDYSKFGEDELHQAVDEFLQQINKAMLEINFRREPIYLSEEELNKPQHARYKFSIAKIPALQTLREHFIGRVVHSSPEQWQNDVKALLKFNVLESDDDKRWEKVGATETRSLQ